MGRARRRAGAWIAVGVALIMAIVSGSVFAYQYTTAYAQCSAIPGPNACASVVPAQIAMDSAFISLFGLLAAIVIALSAGVDWQGLTVPNFALARQIEREEREFRRQHVLLERQQQQAARAQARQFAAAQAAVSEAPAAAAGPAVPVSTAGAILQAAAAAVPEAEPLIEWEFEEERRPEDDAKRRALENRLKALAKRKPEAVAEVLTGWINQGQTP